MSTLLGNRAIRSAVENRDWPTTREVRRRPAKQREFHCPDCLFSTEIEVIYRAHYKERHAAHPRVPKQLAYRPHSWDL